MFFFFLFSTAAEQTHTFKVWQQQQKRDYYNCIASHVSLAIVEEKKAACSGGTGERERETISTSNSGLEEAAKERYV